jgi:hypothetical protein
MSEIFNYINYTDINHVDDYNTPQKIHIFQDVKFRTHVTSYLNFQTPIGINDNKIINITNKQLSFLVQKYIHFLGDEYANELKNTHNELKNNNIDFVIEEEVFQFFDYESVNGTGHSYDLMFYLLYCYKINNLKVKLLVVESDNMYYNGTLNLIKNNFNIEYIFIKPNKTYLFKNFMCTRTYQNVFFNEVKEFINEYLINPIIKKYENINEKYYDKIIKLKYKDINVLNRLNSFFEKTENSISFFTKNNIYDLNNVDNNEELKIYLINKAKHIIITCTSAYYININYYLHDTKNVFITLISHKHEMHALDLFVKYNNVIKQQMFSHLCSNIMDQVYNNLSFNGEIIGNLENTEDLISKLNI